MNIHDYHSEQFADEGKAVGGMLRTAEKSNTKNFDMTSGFVEKAVEAPAEEAYVKNLFVLFNGASFGDSFAREIVATGEHTHLVTSSRYEKQHVTKALLEVSDVPTINHWMSSIKDVSRLAPLHKKFGVLCNADNEDEFQLWGGDEKRCMLPGGCAHLFSNGCSGDARSNPVKDVAAWVAANGAESHVILVDGDYLPEPDFNMQRIVEHSSVRGADTITFTGYRENHTAFDAPKVKFEDLSVGVNPKVSSVGAELGGSAYLGPVLYLRKQTLPFLCEWVAAHEAAATMPPPREALPAFLADLLRVKPVYALEMKYVFSVKSLDAFLYTDNLFEFVAREKAKVASRLRVQDTDSSLDFATSHSTSDVVKRRLHAAYEDQAKALGDMRRQAVARAVDMELILPVFNQRYAIAESAKLQGERDKTLPERFSNASLFRHKPRTQHACYTTTQNLYGVKAPSQQEMPQGWFGSKGDFTTGFKAGMYHNTGFVCSRTTSKVHSALDDF